MNDPLIITAYLRIPLSELRFHFARSGGKGGQNVNKVETKVELTFDVGGSPSLSGGQRETILRRLRARIDADGFLRIVTQESRSQWTNRERAIAKFVRYLHEALQPVKKRVKTTVSHAARQRRLEQKKRRGEIKKTRRSVYE